MRAPLSIVIPTLNAEDELPETLQALFEGISSGAVRELIVSDGGSIDATPAIADAAGAVVVTGPPSRGGQLSRGGAEAAGAWMLFLHADTVLPTGWSEAVTEHINRSSDAAVFRLSFRAGGAAPRIVAAWANFRTRLGLPYGDQALLISRDLYDQTGGYADIPLMEDVDLARRLRGRLRLLRPSVSTSAARYEEDGWIRRGMRNLWLLALYLSGRSPEDLAKRYGRSTARTSPPCR